MAVFMHSAYKVVGYADVARPSMAGHDVNVVLVHYRVQPHPRFFAAAAGSE